MTDITDTFWSVSTGAIGHKLHVNGVIICRHICWQRLLLKGLSACVAPHKQGQHDLHAQRNPSAPLPSDIDHEHAWDTPAIPINPSQRSCTMQLHWAWACSQSDASAISAPIKGSLRTDEACWMTCTCVGLGLLQTWFISMEFCCS